MGFNPAFKGLTDWCPSRHF